MTKISLAATLAASGIDHLADDLWDDLGGTIPAIVLLEVAERTEPARRTSQEALFGATGDVLKHGSGLVTSVSFTSQDAQKIAAVADRLTPEDSR